MDGNPLEIIWLRGETNRGNSIGRRDIPLSIKDLRFFAELSFIWVKLGFESWLGRDELSKLSLLSESDVSLPSSLVM